MREIKCLMVMPGQAPAVTTIEASLTAFNKAVSIGSEYELRAVSKRIGRRTYAIYAYESVFEDLEPNRKIGDEIICGVFYIVAVDDTFNPVSMTEKQMMKYMMRFYELEEYSYHDVLENWSECMLKEFDSVVV
jgi:hypothetical protein